MSYIFGEVLRFHSRACCVYYHIERSRRLLPQEFEDSDHAISYPFQMIARPSACKSIASSIINSRYVGLALSGRARFRKSRAYLNVLSVSISFQYTDSSFVYSESLTFSPAQAYTSWKHHQPWLLVKRKSKRPLQIKVFAVLLHNRPMADQRRFRHDLDP